MKKKLAVIIGAGPAGLTAAYELLKRTDIVPIVLELSNKIGGISRTENFKGFRIDIGGHRFFSKSSKIMQWWLSILPPQELTEEKILKLFPEIQNCKTQVKDIDSEEKVFLVRKRLSRILFNKKFFDYPISLTLSVIRKLGYLNALKIIFSYLRAKMFPKKPEKSLEDFLINRFGKKLYKIFFKDYTEKVWGVPCSKIKPDWGAQRIKGLSISKVIIHASRKIISAIFKKNFSRKDTETSLIEHFLYPKYGPGQLWEEVADKIVQLGGEVRLNSKVIGFEVADKKIVSVKVKDFSKNQIYDIKADYVFSSMPIKDFFNSLPEKDIPPEILDVAKSLQYRSIIVVGLLFDNKTNKLSELKDNWIYIQEPYVKVGRLQIYNNWSPYMLADRKKLWIGLEYFCDEGDKFWQQSDDELIRLALTELEAIGLVSRENFVDGIVIKEAKAYPSYFGSYEKFDLVRNYLNNFENLFCIGRNGMHRYNNQDHSMLTAIAAVDNIINGIASKEDIWNINAEQEYHEEKK